MSSKSRITLTCKKPDEQKVRSFKVQFGAVNIFLGLALAVVGQSAWAATIYKDGNTKLDFTLQALYGAFHSSESYNQGGPVKSGAAGWQEGVLRAGFKGQTLLPGLHDSSLYGETTWVASGTWDGGDAAGYTDGSERRASIDRAYIGWRSGNLMHDWGKDFVDVSVGSQKIQIGDGFIINGDGLSVGNNIADGQFDRGGAYYLTPRNAFHNTVKLHLGAQDLWRGDLIWLKSDNEIKAKPELGIAVLERGDEHATFGLTYIKGLGVDESLANSFSAQRDGLEVVSLRGQGDFGIKDLFLSFEYAHEDKSRGQEHAWYAEGAWTFSQLPWTPRLSYRYSRYSEDYDPLFSGYSRGYGTWFQGEVASNYSGPFQRNAGIHMAELQLHPTANLTLGALAYSFRSLDKRQGDLDASEVDAYVDWSVGENWVISPLVGLYKPKKSAEQGGSQLGNDNLNVYSQLVVAFHF